MITLKSADEILFRPHAIGEIMSGVGKGWPVEKSVTCKRYLIKLYRQIRYERYFNRGSKYTEKGIRAENDAITLYSRYKKMIFEKNPLRFTSDYFTGEPDIITEIQTADVKSVWGLDTLPSKLVDGVDSDYDYQGQAYMSLLNKQKHTVVYCLVNSPIQFIVAEKTKLWNNLDGADFQDPLYIDGCIAIEKAHVFDTAQFYRDNPDAKLTGKPEQYDIPIEERIVEYEITRDEAKIQAIKNRIDECRQWMNVNLFKYGVDPLTV